MTDSSSDTPSDAPSDVPDETSSDAAKDRVEDTVENAPDVAADSPRSDTPPPAIKSSWRRRHWRLSMFLILVVAPVALLIGWTLITLNYSYSEGDRAGYAQKLSKRGWLCKTWEGELAMVNLPGAMPEIFRFSVRSDSIANMIEHNLGKRVTLTYEEHRGVPTSCFGETPYYITNVRQIEP
jgi:hypothetical protein